MKNMNVGEWGALLFEAHRAEMSPAWIRDGEMLLAGGEGYLLAVDIVEWLADQGRLSDHERRTTIDFARRGHFYRLNEEVLEKLEQPVAA
jgi:hypothetical protein